MAPEPTRTADEIFAAALALPPEARAAFLDSVCAGDAALRAEVESLIEVFPAARAHFEQASDAASLLVQAEVGRQVGAYRLTRLIASGGMGAVFAGERVDHAYTKTVAIKLIRPGWGSHEILERFVRERQVLADLEHPNIARLLDGGSTAEGLPYFVMEFVDGEPIHEYADARRLGVRERLALFLQVCEAVHFAHQRLVIHRDLKPGNVLVDHDGRVKLLDFGIAKVFAPDAAGTGDRADATRTAMRLLTPRYASPEQLRGAALTTASDVYSLGVVLFELLSGRLPFDAGSRSPAEIERLICEQTPPRPSRAFESGASGAAAASTDGNAGAEAVAARRGVARRRLARELRGDLDTIVLRALSKEPERRYSGVEELAADLRRHLAGLPVLARPDTAAYRLSSFVRRNTSLTVAVAMLVIVLAAGLVATLAANRRSQALAREAEWVAYVNALAAAEASLRSGSVGEAALRLADAPAALRGWEWRHLRARLDRSLLAWSAHPASVTDVEYSMDGVCIVTGSLDSTVALWNASTAALIRRWGPLASGVESVDLLPDASAAVAGLSTGEVMLLPVEEGVAARLVGRGGQWPMIDVRSDGERVAAGFFDGSAVEWDLASGHVVASWKPHQGLALVAYARDGERIVTAGSEGVAYIWDARTHAPLAEFRGHAKRIYEIALSPDGSRLATGSMDWTADVWEIASRRLLCTYQGHRATVTALVFDASGKRVVSAGGEGHLIRWDAETGQVRNEYRGHATDVSGIAVAPDEAHMVSVDWRGAARIWEIDTEDVRTLSAEFDLGIVPRFRDFAIDSSGHSLVAATATPWLPVWDPSISGKPRQELTERAIYSVAVTARGDRVVTGEDSGYVQIRDMRGGAVPLVVRAHAERIVALAVDARRGRFFTTAGDSAIGVWSLENGAALGSIAAVSSVVLEFSPAADRLAAAIAGGAIVLFDAATLEKRAAFVGHGASVLDLAFSRDGRMLASASSDGSIRVWDSSAQGSSRVVRPANDAASGRVAIGAVAFSPDGARLAAGGTDEVVRLYDIRTLREIIALHGHVAPVTRLAFDASGARLFSSANDGAIRIWEAPEDSGH